MNQEHTKFDFDNLDSFIEDAPTHMSRFQIENFIIKKEPPVGRYHQCCLEIKSRVGMLKQLRNQLDSLSNDDDQSNAQRSGVKDKMISLQKELDIFVELAHYWKSFVGDRNHEEIQKEYWDQKLAFDLCVRLITRQNISDLVGPIMALPQGARSIEILRNCHDVKLIETEIEGILEYHRNGDT